MIKQLLIVSILPVSVAASAACMPDAPEIGDVGPSSELVCEELLRRFPDATLAVEDRSIHSPTDISVAGSVDGRPVILRYSLNGYSWQLDDLGTRTALLPVAQVGVPIIGQ